MSILQNAWNLNGMLLNRQKRRSELVSKCIPSSTKKIIDIGCAEGFTTKYMIDKDRFVVGIEINFDNLRIAKHNVKEVYYINGSIDFLPFTDEFFDATTILEVLEHLPTELQIKGLQEANRVLKSHGTLIISVPYKEQITYTKCIHCNKDTPRYGHLHTLDENKIASLLPQEYSFQLKEKFNIPHMVYISCSNVFKHLPLSIWLKLNNLLGKTKILRGYWIVLKYIKT
jgi:ubiquinone/menaquinone biosynthesis C-methylase UbiE